MALKETLIDWLEQHRDYYHDGSSMSEDASHFGEIAIKEVIAHVQQLPASLTWTTDKPAKEGFYWLRNVETHTGYTQSEPQIVQVFELGNGYPGNFDVSIPSDENTTELRYINKGEWYGPLEVPE